MDTYSATKFWDSPEFFCDFFLSTLTLPNKAKGAMLGPTLFGRSCFDYFLPKTKITRNIYVYFHIQRTSLFYLTKTKLQGVPKTWEFSDEFDIVFVMNWHCNT